MKHLTVLTTPPLHDPGVKLSVELTGIHYEGTVTDILRKRGGHLCYCIEVSHASMDGEPVENCARFIYPSVALDQQMIAV